MIYKNNYKENQIISNDDKNIDFSSTSVVKINKGYKYFYIRLQRW